MIEFSVTIKKTQKLRKKMKYLMIKVQKEHKEDNLKQDKAQKEIKEEAVKLFINTIEVIH